jgi:hypothetical protein
MPYWLNLKSYWTVFLIEKAIHKCKSTPATWIGGICVVIFKSDLLTKNEKNLTFCVLMRIATGGFHFLIWTSARVRYFCFPLNHFFKVHGWATVLFNPTQTYFLLDFPILTVFNFFLLELILPLLIIVCFSCFLVLTQSFVPEWS